MDLLVEVEIGRALATFVVQDHLVVQGADLGQLGVGDASAGELAGEGLQCAHDREQLVDIVGGQAGDAGAAVGSELQQSLRGQDLEGLAQRGAGDAEGLTQHPFGQAGAGRVFALDDHVAQAGGHRVVQRLTCDRTGELAHDRASAGSAASSSRATCTASLSAPSAI